MIISNAPSDYACPICLGVQGIENEQTLLKQADRVYDDELVTVFINSFFVGKNSGHAIVVSNEHFETVYDLPVEVGTRIFEVSKQVAVAMRMAYKCDGITLRQNNEPAGDQHAFHYHQHIFPRYKDDNFNQAVMSDSRLSSPDERIPYAQTLSDALNTKT
jgi:histidine triad (HIT) family protein